MRRLVLIICMSLSCSTAPPTTNEVAAPATCPTELECRLFGDCTQGASDVMSCHAEQCTSQQTDMACLTEQCSSELAQCFFGSRTTGTLNCAGIWRCYGDCGDENDCLHECRKNAAEPSQDLFLEAELCTDHYVFTVCEEGNDECDFNAAKACKPLLLSCLNDHSMSTSQAIKNHCQSSNDPESCEAHNLRILAACPSLDAIKWSDYLNCLLTSEKCTEPELTGICNELNALLSQG